VDGTGAPPYGPADVGGRGNRIALVKRVGNPGVAIDPNDRPKAEPGDHELDLSGHYLLPGSSTCTATSAAPTRARPRSTCSSSGWATASRPCAIPGSGNGLAWMTRRATERAQRDHGAAPVRVRVLRARQQDAARDARGGAALGGGAGEGPRDGLKLMGLRPDLLKATLDEAKKQGCAPPATTRS
jgi:hypothetical protein